MGPSDRQVADDCANGIAVDDAGNPYLVGATNGTLPTSPNPNAGGYDVFLAKYDPAGNRVWVHQLGAGGDDDDGSAIATLGGPIRISGSTAGTLPGSAEGNAGGTDIFVAEYDLNGSRVSVHQLGTSADEGALGIAVDSAGNAYVTGYSDGSLPGTPTPNAGLLDAFIAKYDSSGARLWVREVGTSGEDVGFGIGVDAAGSAYIAGQTEGTMAGASRANAGGFDIFAIKYDTNGNRIWVQETGSGSDDGAYAVGVRLSGSVYVAGFTDGTLPGSSEPNAGDFDAFLLTYPAG